MSTALGLRPPDQVMRLARMGAMHGHRLSFLRVMLRRMFAGGWRFDRPIWRIDAKGVGVATYRLRGPERCYTLVAFGHALPDEDRSDRVIAEAWDATFTLVDGDVTDADLDRLAQAVPLQEAARVSDRELVLSRANRSVRLFSHVIDRLAAGRQPDTEELSHIGYLMRTTAVYGAAKFGTSDRQTWSARPEFAGAFQPEMMTVWLIRAFSIDLVEHMARCRSDRAVRLSLPLRRRLGIGNATGLGMAPFLINHPALLHSWMLARETAFARVRARPLMASSERAEMEELVAKARQEAAEWSVDDPRQQALIEGLRHDLARLADQLPTPETRYPWQELWTWAERTLGLEAQERLVSLLIDLGGADVDDLAETMSADESAPARIDGQMTVETLRRQIERNYAWALATDFDDPDATARLWYVSEDKSEPRLAERAEAPREPYELPLAPGRDAAAANRALLDWPEEATVAAFLLACPEHRHSLRRAQLVARLAYAEIRDNTVAADMLPLDMLRCKLALFGASRFDPRSDRWLRITLFRDCPGPEELVQGQVPRETAAALA
ncbi:MAG: hypothetical protein AAFU49_07755 [Pseudomonadota bacterium]